MLLDRVVMDTNVWITYFYNGEFTQLVDLVVEKGISIYSCEQLTIELATVLSRPKFKNKLTLKLHRYIDFYKQLSTEILVDERFDRVNDVKDNYIIDLAYAAKCSFVITGDPDLLSLKHVGTIQIISLTDFKKKVSSIKT